MTEAAGRDVLASAVVHDRMTGKLAADAGVATKYKYYRWRCGRDARLAKLCGNSAGR